MNKIKKNLIKKKFSSKKKIKPFVKNTKNVVNKSNSQLKKLIFFSIKFFLIFFILIYLIEIIDLSFISTVLAGIVSSFLGLSVINNQVLVGKTVFTISNACLGFFSISILIAIVFSLKKLELVKKVSLVLIGGGIIFLLNIPRLILVVYSAMIGFDADLVHSLTWFLMSGLILLILIFGLKYLYKKELYELI